MSTINRQVLRDMRKDLYIMWPAVGSITGIIGCLVFVLMFQKSLPGQVPLLYSLPWGDERLVPTEWLTYLLVGTFVVVMVNGILEVILFQYEEILSRLLSLGSLVVTVLTVYTIVRIVLVIV